MYVCCMYVLDSYVYGPPHIGSDKVQSTALPKFDKFGCFQYNPAHSRRCPRTFADVAWQLGTSSILLEPPIDYPCSAVVNCVRG